MAANEAELQQIEAASNPCLVRDLSILQPLQPLQPDQSRKGKLHDLHANYTPSNPYTERGRVQNYTPTRATLSNQPLYLLRKRPNRALTRYEYIRINRT